MSNLILALTICPLAGAALKLADSMSEQQTNPSMCFFASGISGILIGSLISFDAFSSAMFSGIVAGVILAGKVDRPCLGFGLIVTALTAWLLGPKIPVLLPLLLTILASFADEIGHDRYLRTGGFSRLFEYRFILKLTIILLWLARIMPLHSLGMFFLFDLAYDLSSRILRSQGQCHVP